MKIHARNFRRRPRSSGSEQRHPTRVDVHLLAWLAVSHRNRRRSLTESELADGEPVERRVRHVDATAVQQPLDLRKPHALEQQPLDLGALGLAPLPTVAVRPSRVGRQRGDHAGDVLVAERLGPRREPAALCCGEVTTDGLHVQRQLRGDPLLLGTGSPEPEDFFDFDHRDLAVRHRPGRSMAALSRGGRGGMVLRKSARPGGMVLSKTGFRGPHQLRANRITGGQSRVGLR